MEANAVNFEELITVNRAAELAQVSPGTIRRGQREQGLGETRMGGKIYTTEGDLQRFARHCTLQAQRPPQETVERLTAILEGE